MLVRTIRALASRLIDRLLGPAARAGRLDWDDDIRIVLNPELPAAAARAKVAGAAAAQDRSLRLVAPAAGPQLHRRSPQGASRGRAAAQHPRAVS
jgi:hypothetical protein